VSLLSASQRRSEPWCMMRSHRQFAFEKKLLQLIRCLQENTYGESPRDLNQAYVSVFLSSLCFSADATRQEAS